MDLVDHLLTVSDVAAALSVSKRTAYRLLSEDHAIPSIRVRGSLRVSMVALNRYLESLGAQQGAV